MDALLTVATSGESKSWNFGCIDVLVMKAVKGTVA